MKDKICFSKTFAYLVLLIFAVAGFFIIVNYSTQQKLALNSRAATRFGGGITPTPIPVTLIPVFTLTELRQRAQSVLDKLTVAKSRSATMDTTSIQGEIESVNKKLNLANSSFNNLTQKVSSTIFQLQGKLNINTTLKNNAQNAYESARTMYNKESVAKFNQLSHVYNDSVTEFNRLLDLYNKSADRSGRGFSQVVMDNNKKALDGARTVMNQASAELEKARVDMNLAKVALEKKLVDFNTYKALETFINAKINSTKNISINLSVNKKLPDLINNNDVLIPTVLINGTLITSVVNAFLNYNTSYNTALTSTYDAYKNLDIEIKNAEEKVIPSQVQAYANYCSNVKPGTYYSILGVDQLPLDKAQQYYDDYCGQNSTGYGWNGIVGNYGDSGGAMCYTATGLCSPIADCKKVDCISRIGKGIACLNKPVTDVAGKAACAAKYLGSKLKIDILTKNACPQNSSNKIGWYGGRDYKVTNANGTSTTISGSDTCLRLNAANSGPSSCNQVISDNYCGCKDAGFTYILVNGTYKNMVDELYGNTALYRPKRSTSKPENITADGRFERCPFSL